VAQEGEHKAAATSSATRSLAEKIRFIELRASGTSLRKISSILGVSESILLLWSRELANEVVTARGIAFDEVFQTKKISREARLAEFGLLAERIRSEIALRDLSNVPTDKLVELMIRLDSKIGELYVEPQVTVTRKERDFMGVEAEVTERMALV
jgi:hypothetical protein